MASSCPHCGSVLKSGPQPSDKDSSKEPKVSCETGYDDQKNPDVEQTQVSESVSAPQTTIVSQLSSTTSQPSLAPAYSAPVAEPPIAYQPAKSDNSTLIAIIVLLVVIICGVGGYLYYDNVYLPAKIDREAPRYYTMANVVVLRSSRSAGADFNKVASLPYGTELITYEHGGEWSRVKVNTQNGEKQEGFVASPYILDKADFFLMNSIFGNQQSKEAIITSKCRMALLEYFKGMQYIGKIDDDLRIDAGINVTPNSGNQWQVFTKLKDAKPNSFLYKRLYKSNSQFTDFAVLITNISTKERKLLYFYFDDDETPHLLTEQDAPSEGYIVNATYDYDFYSSTKVLNVEYSY